ncbi:MAG: DeoR/GlpR family DNA-binding transcription regulator [Runella sp.]
MENIVHNISKQERKILIIRELNLRNKVLSTDLSTLLGVSEDTIRRDLNELSDEGKLIKVHGGALSNAYHVGIQQSVIYAHQEKEVIAKKTIQLLKDNMFVLIGGGTTIQMLIKFLPNELRTTFFTNNLLTALQLLEHPSCKVFFLGGELSRTIQGSIGLVAQQQLTDIHADLYITGVNAIDTHLGISDSDMDAVLVKRAMIQNAKKVAVLTISEKLNSSQQIRVCPLDNIDYLITELSPNDVLLEAYQNSDICII